jgi:hypothetical protein
MELELNELIRKVLEQMSEVKGTKFKNKYLVKEIEFELSLSSMNGGKIGATLMGIGGAAQTEVKNDQRIRVKLKPKSTQGSSIIMSV